jgi:LPXTG-motif cell wall-anchored protein
MMEFFLVIAACGLLVGLPAGYLAVKRKRQAKELAKNWADDSLTKNR